MPGTKKGDDEELPTIWEVFSAIRVVRDGLKRMYEGGYIAPSLTIEDAIETLTKYGDYDEPLILTIKAARDAEGNPGACLELDRLADIRDI